MKIAIGADHGGYELKEEIKKALSKQGYELLDCGTDSDESVDYPDFGLSVSENVVDKKADLGILVCKTGIGQSITANKIPGVRAALCQSEDQAKMSRLHNDANVLVFGAKYTDAVLALKLVDIFINTEFEGGRHQRRLDKIKDIEKRYRRPDKGDINE